MAVRRSEIESYRILSSYWIYEIASIVLLWHCLLQKFSWSCPVLSVGQKDAAKAKKGWGQSSPSLSKHSQPGKAWTAPFPGVEDTFEVDSKSKCCEQNEILFSKPIQICIVWANVTYTWYIMILHMASLHATAVFLWNGCFVSSSLIQEIKAAEVQPGWTFPPAFGDEKGFGVEPSNVRSSEAAGMAGNSPVDLKHLNPHDSDYHIKIYQNTGFHQTPAWIYFEHPGARVHSRTLWILAIGHALLDMASRLPIRRRWATTCAFNSLLPLKRNTPPRWTVQSISKSTLILGKWFRLGALSMHISFLVLILWQSFAGRHWAPKGTTVDLHHFSIWAWIWLTCYWSWAPWGG